MSRIRALLAALGLLLAVGGFVLLIAPELAVGLTTDDVMVTLLGTVAFSQAVFAAIRYVSCRQPAVPAPESREGVRTPGGPFDEALRRLDPDVRERLRSSAVDILSQFGAESPREVRQRLETGKWTDDGLAAAFFSPERSVRRLRRPPWLGGTPLVVEQAIAVVESLSRHVREHSPNELGDGRAATDRSELEAGSGAFQGSNSAVEPPRGAENRTGRRTERWRGVEAVTLFTVALGALLSSSSFLLIGGLGVALVGYAAFGRAGSAESVELSVEREIEPDTPAPGEYVTVTATLRNEGSQLLPDLRIYDGTPSGLAVTDGAARHAATLRPGRETRFSYTLEAEYGEHRFDPAIVRVGDVTGERRRVVEADGDDSRLRCRLPPTPTPEPPLRSFVSKYAGQVTADEGGSGVQFHETREYHRGDPVSLIDWKSLARTGELTALEFSEERIVKVMTVVDARPQSNLAPAPSRRSAIARSAEAADRLVDAFLTENNRVGVAMVASKHRVLGLGSGSDHRLKAQQLLVDYPSIVQAAPSTSTTFQTARIRRHLSGRTQVLLFSPLCDDAPVSFLRRLEASGTPTTVVSPDPTTTATPGETLAALERLARIETLRTAGVSVIDWPRNESLLVALERRNRR